MVLYRSSADSGGGGRSLVVLYIGYPLKEGRRVKGIGEEPIPFFTSETESPVRRPDLGRSLSDEDAPASNQLARLG